MTGGDGDTIAAIATAPGRGGVAVVRISGPDAFPVAEKVARKPHGFFAGKGGRFFRAAFHDADGQLLDDGLALVFESPKSYTGENVVEFQCHGGIRAPELVLQAALTAGARLARRGEFTLRAFLSGRMSLSEAEAVIDLIDSRTDKAAADAAKRLTGQGREFYESLYAESLALAADIEHVLDFDENELPEDFCNGLRVRAEGLKCRIIQQAGSVREGKLLHQGALVVILGPPNAGKSSLLNALAGENRAIVDPTAGTTRDAIEVQLEIGGFPVRLVDTAGVRENAENRIEAEGIRLAEDLAADADVVVLAAEAGKTGAWVSPPAGKPVIVAATKCDTSNPIFDSPAGWVVVQTSAATGQGIGDLRKAIAGALRRISAKGDESNTPDATVREAGLLNSAAAFLEEGIAAMVDGGELALAAGAFGCASEKLAEITGKSYKSDLLDSLFSRFCIGK